MTLAQSATTRSTILLSMLTASSLSTSLSLYQSPTRHVTLAFSAMVLSAILVPTTRHTSLAFATSVLSALTTTFAAIVKRTHQTSTTRLTRSSSSRLPFVVYQSRLSRTSQLHLLFVMVTIFPSAQAGLWRSNSAHTTQVSRGRHH